jgi:hypothetical protein
MGGGPETSTSAKERKVVMGEFNLVKTREKGGGGGRGWLPAHRKNVENEKKTEAKNEEVIFFGFCFPSQLVVVVVVAVVRW